MSGHPVAPGSAQAAALDWVLAVGNGDFEGLWSAMEAQARLCRAQEWIWRNRAHKTIEAWNRDDLALQLAAGDRSCPPWEPFSEGTVAYYRGAFEALLSAPIYTLGRDRPLQPGTELVFLTNEHWDGDKEWDQLPGRVFLMGHNGCLWLIAGFGTDRQIPGWPPSVPEKGGPLVI